MPFLLVLLLICARLCESKEAKCYSRFDYEEKLLEKAIRTDIKVEEAIGKLDTAMEKIEGKYPYHSELEKLKNDLKRSDELLLATVEDEVKNLREQVRHFEAMLMSPRIAFNVKGVTDTSPNTGQIIVFQTVILNNGNAFKVQTGVFTSPVNGTFMFSVQLCSSFRQHGSFKLVADDVTLLSISNFNYASGLTSTSGTAVHHLKAGDRVWVQNEYDAGSSAILEDSDRERACWNQFTGVLINLDTTD